MKQYRLEWGNNHNSVSLHSHFVADGKALSDQAAMNSLRRNMRRYDF